MPKISDLSREDRATINVLRSFKNQTLSGDKITGMIDSLVNGIRQDFFGAHPEAINGESWDYETTTINGRTPPGKLLPLQGAHEVVDEITGEHHYRVSIGTRVAGTRVGIHVHEEGGTTFVIGGKVGRITDLVQGYPNALNPFGSYYYMPSNIPMAAANYSNQDVLLMDIFINTVGIPPITIIEPGYPGYNLPQ